MTTKLSLYFYTIKEMKLSQVFYRIRKMVGLKCSLGCNVKKLCTRDIVPVPVPRELDFDNIFLSRFSADELLENKVTFLHVTQKFGWDESWECENQTALWNFNLHYFEFLFVLIDAYQKTGNRRYLIKTKECISAWIRQNPQGSGGAAWSAYTISLRLTNWLSYYGNIQKEIENDKEFSEKFLGSIYEQYVYLSKHLEKDILGNHYFENLKALVLCSLFFRDEVVYKKALKELKKECRGQILKDGMHFELSPMYHKIIFEDMLRVAYAIRKIKGPDQEIEVYLKPMMDVAFSFENGLERIPLFNDGGDNVAKSLTALETAAKRYFDIIPVAKKKFTESGYYIFEKSGWKLIVDAGQPGPSYIPGHAHCDAMSFELYKEGKPVLVNCGTYAYQCKEREYFRSTRAHNSVMINDMERSQCWGAFRLAKRASVNVISAGENSLSIKMKDQKGQEVIREIIFDEKQIHITDYSRGNDLKSFVHLPLNQNYENSAGLIQMNTICKYRETEALYAPEYGVLQKVQMFEISGKDKIEFTIELGGM